MEMARGGLRLNLAFAFGILGNVISFAVFLTPIRTFYRIYRKKSVEGFQSVPYVVALFSAMLWIYYAIVKVNDTLLLKTINSAGCVIETFYIALFLLYATRHSRIFTLRLLFVLNVLVFCLIVVCTLCLVKVMYRVQVIGWICVCFAVAVFAAPLSIMRIVIKTRSVEFMPLPLSLALTLSAVAWFLHGFLIRDYCVATPNVLGFALGLAQMMLYLCYKNAKRNVELTVPDDVNQRRLENGDGPEFQQPGESTVIGGQQENGLEGKELGPVDKFRSDLG